MTKRLYILIVIASVLSTMPIISAYGQSARLILADIPFNFVVKDRAFPAGKYTLEAIQVGATQSLKIQSADGSITAMFPTRLAAATARQAEPTVVFNRFGDQYFLSRVLGLEENEACTLTTFRAEEALAKRTNTNERNVVAITGNR